MFDSLKRSVNDYLRSLIPLRARTRWNSLSSESYKASHLDVDALHSALRQAEGGDVRTLFAIYRDSVLGDPHIQSEFAKRKLAIIGDTFSILPENKTLPEDVDAAARIKTMIDDVSDWHIAIGHLMDSVLWPVSVLEKTYRPTRDGYELASLTPVPHDLLCFRTGSLRIRETDARGYPNNQTHAPDPRVYIVHRNHLLTTPDHWGGPMRSILFWWLLGAMDRDWWARFLDRFGSPFLVGHYNQGDDDSRSLLERAFSVATRIGGLVVSKDTTIDIQQAATQGTGDAFEKFYTISRREISKLIVGQTLSAEAQSTGLGSGVANNQAEVRDDYRKFDAQVIGGTLRDHLFRPFLSYNGLGHVGVPRISWGSVSPAEAKATGELLVSINTAGLRIADTGLDSLSERIGLPIERAVAAALPPPGLAPASILSVLAANLPARVDRADSAIDSIAESGSADLAQAFRGRLAPIARMIRESSSAEDLELRIKAYSAAAPGRAGQLIEEALIAMAANGVSR
jgi:phage gp29-like protein